MNGMEDSDINLHTGAMPLKQACAATQVHGDIWTLTDAEGYLWVHGSSEAKSLPKLGSLNSWATQSELAGNLCFLHGPGQV